MTKLTYTPMSDAFIKVYFTKYPHRLKSLIAAALELKPSELHDFTLTGAELSPDDVQGKFCRLDISAKIQGKLINIEVQNEVSPDYKKRATFYTSRLYSGAINSGENYSDIPDVIHISLLGEVLFEASPEYLSQFYLREKTRGEILTKSFSMIFLEVSKLDKSKHDKTKLEIWLEIFSAKDTLDFQAIEREGDTEMQQIACEVKAMLQDPTYEDIQRLRDKDRGTKRIELNAAWKRGLSEGRIEGRAEGRSDLIAAMSAKGLDVATIADITNLTEADVQQYLK